MLARPGVDDMAAIAGIDPQRVEPAGAAERVGNLPIDRCRPETLPQDEFYLKAKLHVQLNWGPPSTPLQFPIHFHV